MVRTIAPPIAIRTKIGIVKMLVGACPAVIVTIPSVVEQLALHFNVSVLSWNDRYDNCLNVLIMDSTPSSKFWWLVH